MYEGNKPQKGLTKGCEVLMGWTNCPHGKSTDTCLFKKWSKDHKMDPKAASAAGKGGRW